MSRSSQALALAALLGFAALLVCAAARPSSGYATSSPPRRARSLSIFRVTLFGVVPPQPGSD